LSVGHDVLSVGVVLVRHFTVLYALTSGAVTVAGTLLAAGAAALL
jgi:hypothetical protein